jgi:hypothetical protein
LHVSSLQCMPFASAILFIWSPLYVIFSEEYRVWNFSCSFLYFSIVSSLIVPNIICTLFSNTLVLCFSHNIRNQVSHQCVTTGEIMVYHILILRFLGRRWEDKTFWTEC